MVLNHMREYDQEMSRAIELFHWHRLKTTYWSHQCYPISAERTVLLYRDIEHH